MAEFEWDAGKAPRNVRRHGVSFEEAVSVFFDPFAITTPDEAHSQTEERERTIGVSSKLRVLVVIHTSQSADVIRIISARKAGRTEAEYYEEEVRQRLDALEG